MHKFAYHIGDAGAFLARRITAGIPGVFYDNATPYQQAPPPGEKCGLAIVLVDASRDLGSASTAIRHRAIDPSTRVTSSGKRREYVRLYDGRFDACKLEAQNTDILFATYPAGTSIPTHSHDTDNYGVITRGELILTMNNEVTKYVVGDWYQVPAGVEHAARFEKETDEIEFWFSAET